MTLDKLLTARQAGLILPSKLDIFLDRQVLAAEWFHGPDEDECGIVLKAANKVISDVARFASGAGTPALAVRASRWIGLF